MRGAQTRPTPRLAYVYHPLSFAPFSILDAAQGLCELVWVVDSSQEGSAAMQRLLRRSGPIVDAGGREFTDVAAELREYGVTGITSLHDSDLLWTARVAHELELPFHSVESAMLLTDKHAQRAALKAGGLVVPAFLTIPPMSDEAALGAIAAGFPFPAVLKPREGQASRDTMPVASLAELVATVAAFAARPGATAVEYVLEAFVPDPSDPLGGDGFAPFVSVESVVEHGRIVHAAISSRTPFRWPFRETGYSTPTAIDAALQGEILEVAGAAAAALNITIGCLHTEIKLTDRGPVVIEVNGRPGGGMSEMLERASGFSILRTALQLAVGDPVGLDGPVATDRIGYLLYVFPRTDVEWIDTVEGLDELRAVPGVDEIVLVRGPGQRIDWREGSEAHVFHLTGTVDNLDELRRLISLTTTLVRIEGHDGDPAAPTAIPRPVPSALTSLRTAPWT